MTMNAAIFDLDGTLINSRGTILRCLNETVVQYGKEPFGPDEVKSLIGKHLMEILALRDCDNREAADKYTEIQLRTYKRDLKIYDGATEMLAALKSEGYKLGVATMRRGSITREILGGMGMSQYFKAVVGVDDAEKGKPHPEHVLAACRLLETQPEECVMVGDTRFDIISGRDAGCKTVGVLWGNGTSESLTEAGADKLAETMGQLHEIILKL